MSEQLEVKPDADDGQCGGNADCRVEGLRVVAYDIPAAASVAIIRSAIR